MYNIGIDVSNKNTFVHVVDGRGRKIESQEIPTDKDGYRQYFAAGRTSRYALQLKLAATPDGSTTRS